MNIFKKYSLLLNFEIALAFIISILISEILGLENSITAGVVTLLSIQTTKTQTVNIAAKRVIGYFIMLVMVILIFNTLGYNLISFGIFVFLFALINSRFNISIGLAPNVVMAGHFYARQTTDINFIFNETAIYLIAVAVAIVVNLIIPVTKSREKEKYNIDNSIRKILLSLSNIINEDYKKKFNKNEYITDIENKIQIAFKEMEDYEKTVIYKLENDILNNDIYDLEYINMRKNQFNILNKIFELTKKLNKKYYQSEAIAIFLKEIESDYDENNNVVELMNKSKDLLDKFSNSELPQDRTEFENRAILYTIMSDINSFLMEKYDFINRIQDENKN